MRSKFCPICGSERTHFCDLYSDGDEIVEVELDRQHCLNIACGLPCRFWDGLTDVLDALHDDESISLRDSRWYWTGNGDFVFDAI